VICFFCIFCTSELTVIMISVLIYFVICVYYLLQVLEYSRRTLQVSVSDHEVYRHILLQVYKYLQLHKSGGNYHIATKSYLDPSMQ